MTPSISIIHPSRGRSEKSFNAIKLFLHHSGGENNIEVIVSVDEDDPHLSHYKRSHNGNVIVNKNRSAVDAINNAAKVSKGDILMVVSDDTDSPVGWRSQLLNIIAGKKDFILKTQDGIQKWIITMPIMDRTYYNRFGYIYYPEYKHMFCDTELTMVADLTGRKITSNLLFPHKQYSVTGEKPDEVNKRADATWNQGEKLFLERIKKNFDLKPEDIKGKVTDPSYINWARSKGVRI